ncbi:MAG TPA: Holliday junction branch migration protein RuvA [Povalibacter sp.]|uniref:Holliday junction branch migration protein RuvA n=1 Tax=Povalibacter sp. TaxID=1962978 RepID=UPI002C6D432C|nr:Holliday junction branch migration protein RuvA [Povalibacter sp.]HMN46248.1 Holliday junction branch migration protein RuvA [Povalibacter sp.]
MIGFLRGRLAAKHPPQLLVDVGGVGYEVEAPMSTFYVLPAIGADVNLFTHLVVREDAHVLFGFGSERERRLFRELIKVSNVGPKLALALLSGMSVENFLACIEAQDADMLVKIPGVGRKTAERLLIEMKDRIKNLTGFAAVLPVAEGGTVNSGSGAQSEAFSALVALGYKPAEVTRLLKSVDPAAKTTEELIRGALQAAAAQ